MCAFSSSQVLSPEPPPPPTSWIWCLSIIIRMWCLLSHLSGHWGLVVTWLLLGVFLGILAACRAMVSWDTGRWMTFGSSLWLWPHSIPVLVLKSFMLALDLGGGGLSFSFSVILVEGGFCRRTLHLCKLRLHSCWRPCAYKVIGLQNLVIEIQSPCFLDRLCSAASQERSHRNNDMVFKNILTYVSLNAYNRKIGKSKKKKRIMYTLNHTL